MATEITKARTATHRVIYTTELLEAILLQLPNKDILVHVQRVCLYFYNTISRSVALQHHLFFLPCPRRFTTTIHRNPFLYARSWTDYIDHRIPKYSPMSTSGPPPSFYPWHNDLDLTAVDWEAYRKLRVPFERPEASWRRMYVSQPPVTTLEADSTTGFWGLRCTTGLTLGMLEANWMVDWTGLIIRAGRPNLSVVINASPIFEEDKWW